MLYQCDSLWIDLSNWGFPNLEFDWTKNEAPRFNVSKAPGQFAYDDLSQFWGKLGSSSDSYFEPFRENTLPRWGTDPTGTIPPEQCPRTGERQTAYDQMNLKYKEAYDACNGSSTCRNEAKAVRDADYEAAQLIDL